MWKKFFVKGRKHIMKNGYHRFKAPLFSGAKENHRLGRSRLRRSYSGNIRLVDQSTWDDGSPGFLVEYNSRAGLREDFMRKK
jgi:hypothetical protein